MPKRLKCTPVGPWPRALIESIGCCVYAIQCRSTHRFMLGATSNLWPHWRTITTAAPTDLDLLGWWRYDHRAAARDAESELFEEHADHRVALKGKWFRDAKSVRRAAGYIALFSHIDLEEWEQLDDLGDPRWSARDL